MIDAAVRKRASAALFVAVALGTTGFVASMTVAPLLGEDLSGSTSLSGLPWAAGVLGTGVGSFSLSQLMAARGRGPGLLLGYGAGLVGAGLTVVAAVTGSFALLVAAVFVMGGGNAANHLSRYAAADLYPPERRATGLSTVVWAGAIGGMTGPALLAPTGSWAGGLELPTLTGPFLASAIACAGAVGVLAAARRRARPAFAKADDVPVVVRLSEVVRSPHVRLAMVSLAAAQTVMVLVMAMTPLHMRDHGHGLGAVGLVISLHVFGMYGLSPVSGRLADRFGHVRALTAGFVTLLVGAVIAALPAAHVGLAITVPLFLIGFGWSLAFVAGSALLTAGLGYRVRARLQGTTDAIVWTSAAAAGLGSGLLVGAFGYSALCVAGAGLLAVPLVMIARRRALPAAPGAAAA